MHSLQPDMLFDREIILNDAYKRKKFDKRFYDGSAHAQAENFLPSFPSDRSEMQQFLK